MSRILCLWLPNWPVQRLAHTRPELLNTDASRVDVGKLLNTDVSPVPRSVGNALRGVPDFSSLPERHGGRSLQKKRKSLHLNHQKALVLFEPQRRGGVLKVAACCPRADELGITVGMTLAEATTFAGTRESEAAGERRIKQRRKAAAAEPVFLHLEPYDPEADRRVLVALAEWCETFSPSVGLEEAERPECLLLDVAGLGPLFGGEQALAQRVADAFARRGFLARVAIADTIGTAWAVAHFSHPDFRVPLVACPPVLIVPPGQSLSALSPLPVRALRLPDEILGLLHKLGIHSIGQLLALPRESLASRFGNQLGQRLGQALGNAREVVETERPSTPIEAQWTFESPTGQHDALLLALGQLIDRVSAVLAPRRHGALEVEFRLSCPFSEPAWFSIGLFRPSVSAKHLLELAQLRLERLKLSGPVAGLHVLVSRTAPLQYQQQAMFEGSEASDSRRQMSWLIDRLGSRLSREAVLRAQLIPDAQPEYAYCCRPVTETSSKTKAVKSQPRAGPLQRPLWLEARPVPIEAIALAPDGPPTQFRWEGQEHRVKQTWGPERIETGWWRGRSVRRDYFRIETITANRFWLFRCRSSGKWFLQGRFE